MNKNKVFGVLIGFGLLFLISALLLGCAATQNPQGGPRDTIPPKILKSEPKNLTTNFSAKKIILEFDEYIKLQNEFKEFSISPELEKPPMLKARLKKLEITLEDSLEKNTTYTLNFGKAIADINEGNIVKNLSYVFSTGTTLDSLSLSGVVKNSVSGKVIKDATVFVFPLAKDSLLGKKKPSIYTLTDSLGNFKINNLKKETYRIYALDEGAGGDKIYQQNTDEIGFATDPLVLSSNIEGIQLNTFKEIAEKFRVVDRKLNGDGSIYLTFNKRLVKPSLSVVEPEIFNQNMLVKFVKTNDTAQIWLNKLDFDSVKIAIKEGEQTLETIKISRGKKDTYSRNLLARDNIENGVLNPNKDLKLYFNLPVNKIDLNKIILLEDSIPKSGFTIAKDSSDLLAYTVKYPWKKKEKYILSFFKEAVTGIFDSKTAVMNKAFVLGNSGDYGTLVLTVKATDTTKNYILEIVDEKKETIISSKVINKTETITFANYKSGLYYARIIYDENNNGRWDTGNVGKGKQPEKIWYDPKELSIRANWDRKEQIIIPKE